MQRFENNQRIKVVGPELPQLLGRTGMVVRLRMADCQAWVAMDKDIPEQFRAFPKTDSHGRANHVLLHPMDCEPA